MPFTVVCVLHLMCTNTHTRELYHPMGLPTILKSRRGSYKETLSTFSLCQRLEYVMGKAIDGRGSDLGLMIIPRCSRVLPAVSLTVLHYADDIALLSYTVSQAQTLLDLVEV